MHVCAQRRCAERGLGDLGPWRDRPPGSMLCCTAHLRSRHARRRRRGRPDRSDDHGCTGPSGPRRHARRPGPGARSRRLGATGGHAVPARARLPPAGPRGPGQAVARGLGAWQGSAEPMRVPALRTDAWWGCGRAARPSSGRSARLCGRVRGSRCERPVDAVTVEHDRVAGLEVDGRTSRPTWSSTRPVAAASVAGRSRPPRATAGSPTSTAGTACVPVRSRVRPPCPSGGWRPSTATRCCSSSTSTATSPSSSCEPRPTTSCACCTRRWASRRRAVRARARPVDRSGAVRPDHRGDGRRRAAQRLPRPAQPRRAGGAGRRGRHDDAHRRPRDRDGGAAGGGAGRPPRGVPGPGRGRRRGPEDFDAWCEEQLHPSGSTTTSGPTRRGPRGSAGPTSTSTARRPPTSRPRQRRTRR